MLRAGALLLVAAVASGCAVGVTDPPTEITGAGATFNGTVFSNVEGTTNYWVKYGTTTDYGSSTDQQSVEIDDGDGRPVTVKVRGLAPKTTYHARLCAKDSQAEAGPGCSDGQTFTTLNEDSITGVAASGGCNPECFVLRRIFDAYSSPTGGNPHGTMVLESETADGVDTLNTYDVTCLNVQGNRAAVALRGRDQGFPVPPTLGSGSLTELTTARTRLGSRITTPRRRPAPSTRRAQRRRTTPRTTSSATPSPRAADWLITAGFEFRCRADRLRSAATQRLTKVLKDPPRQAVPAARTLHGASGGVTT